jgi:putative membrane protein
MPEVEEKLGSIRDYLSAERTLLSHVRTALALCGFGFVVARVGTFVPNAEPGNGLAQWFGTALVILGAVVSMVALFDYVRVVKRLNAAAGQNLSPSTLAIAVAAIFSLIGISMAGYLLLA